MCQRCAHQCSHTADTGSIVFPTLQMKVLASLREFWDLLKVTQPIRSSNSTSLLQRKKNAKVTFTSNQTKNDKELKKFLSKWIAKHAMVINLFECVRFSQFVYIRT
jgi:hypothetical protein